MIAVTCCFLMSLLIAYYYTQQHTDNKDDRLEAFNNMCHSWTWMPVFLKVYLIGIAETLFIVMNKRFGAKGQLYHEAQVDALVHQAKDGDSDKLAVITGGDSGIGLEICRGLLLANFHVILGTRSTPLAEQVVKSLKGSDRVVCIPLDLASFESVRAFAERVKETNKNIQLLINNAGVMNVPYTKTEDGFESQCQINCLSPFLLTQLLLPYVSGKVLFASSSTMYAPSHIRTTKSTESYSLDGLGHYAFSKSCVAHLVQELAKTTSIPVYSYHPGTVRTKLFAHTTIFNLPLMSKLFDFIMLSPKEGSKTPLYLCLTNVLGPSGTYWANERVQTIPKIWVNGKMGDIESLWSDTLRCCGIKE